jgi:hypothetical protein
MIECARDVLEDSVRPEVVAILQREGIIGKALLPGAYRDIEVLGLIGWVVASSERSWEGKGKRFRLSRRGQGFPRRIVFAHVGVTLNDTKWSY